VLALASLAVVASCGDGRPAFCDDLARSANMSALTSALDARDLTKARAAATDFRELADRAPDDVRSDLRDLAAAISDIVDLIAAQRGATLGAEGGRTPQDDGTQTVSGVDQDRAKLNTRLGELSTVSSRVERWAARNCGLTLG